MFQERRQQASVDAEALAMQEELAALEAENAALEIAIAVSTASRIDYSRPFSPRPRCRSMI